MAMPPASPTASDDRDRADMLRLAAYYSARGKQDVNRT
jgi:hypothetical protein